MRVHHPLTFRSLSRSTRLYSLLMAGQFFVIIAVFWIFKPLKKALFIQTYESDPLQVFSLTLKAAQTELLAKHLNMAVAFVAMLVFVSISRHFKKARLQMIMCAITSALLLLVAVGLNNGATWGIWAFYLFGDLFNMLMIAGFFAFLGDSVNKELAKRIYGNIILGGVIGGAVGATLVGTMSTMLPLNAWISISLGCIGLIALLARLGGQHIPVQQFETTAPPLLDDNATSPPRRLRHSPYVLSIAAIVLFYELVSSLVDYQFTATVENNLSGPAIGAFFSSVYMTVTIVSVVVQLFLTSALMKRRGVTLPLLLLPLTLLGGTVTFLFVPALLVGAFLCVCDNGFNYSIHQSAKETLYTRVTPLQRYRAKGMIDIFLQRVAKTAAILLTLILSLIAPLRLITGITLFLIGGWLLASRYAGERFDADDSSLHRDSTGGAFSLRRMARGLTSIF